ncbi:MULTISPECIES: TetR/AcrR family transcriptional regulator [unclassified Streptomyces]|uniref:TetR/AcrR family transcriptional regulator n=1 Tax=unclassified Streptomyces TaxID=2593676 RepID=UPI0006F8C185|nr:MULTISPECIES: TetR/AcrR family transcriptional regulator [unclassified Streptomyces]KQX57456.1 TetR family transcriptional regulator [Streptomyces sp. Root1304]KRA98828.1 TetR family transcriptional regulator [Streptomyces sp. Root66D1]
MTASAASSASEPTAPSEATAPPEPLGSRAERIGDAALDLLVERGMRGLTHRAVDERAGLPQGSTSNHARTRQALLEAAVRRQVQLEARVLTPEEMPGAAGGRVRPGADGRPGADNRPEAHDRPDPDGHPAPDALVDALALALHRYLTDHRALLVSRYELALEATRRPELRAFFDDAGSVFHGPLVAMMTAAGSPAPERHALSLIAWCEGLMFSCAAGSFHSAVPSRTELRTGFDELLRGMLGNRSPRPA